MPKRNEEILNCDSIKIVMMISVILYHSMALWNRGGWFDQLPSSSSPSITFIATWLNSIHIYTFVFISGYLFYFLKYEIGKYQKYKEFIWRKIVRLIVPYCSAAILWCVPFYQYFFKGCIFRSQKTICTVKLYHPSG